MVSGLDHGRATECNILGYVAPCSIPEVVRDLNAFALGARSVNPEAEVHPVWILNWFDPVAEREAAQALLDVGADVIARESDSTEPDKLAEGSGIFAMGCNAVSEDIAPNALLTAPVWDWSACYKQTIEAAYNGEWESHAYWRHVADGIMSLEALGGMVPQEVQGEINAAEKRIVADDLHPFTGPISDSTGQKRVVAGETLDTGTLLGFDWLVEGVTGAIPSNWSPPTAYPPQRGAFVALPLCLSTLR
ncbi:MAG: BMP family ABC transporter substrate-binding protein [Anaerolineae bacterium]|nr:BMP family ABC transporter substrate-binding protein [Anaerolineae bacterium]